MEISALAVSPSGSLIATGDETSTLHGEYPLHSRHECFGNNGPDHNRQCCSDGPIFSVATYFGTTILPTLCGSLCEETLLVPQSQ